MKPYIRLAIAVLIITTLVMLSLGAKGCGGKDKPVLVTAYEASVRFSATADSAAQSVLNRFNEGNISLETKDAIFAKLKIFSQAGRTFHSEVSGLKARFPTGNVPASELLKVETLFDSGIYGPFLDLLEMVKVLPADQRALVELAIATLKVVISQIRRAFSSNASNEIVARILSGRLVEKYG